MRDQVQKRDLLSIFDWRRHAVWQEIRNGKVQSDLSLHNHVGQQKTSEHFRDGADFKKALEIDWRAVFSARQADGFHLTTIGIDQCCGQSMA